MCPILNLITIKQLAIDDLRFYDELRVTTKEMYLLPFFIYFSENTRAEDHLRLQSANTQAHIEAHIYVQHCVSFAHRVEIS